MTCGRSSCRSGSGNPSSACSDRSGTSSSRIVVTPSTAVSARGITEMVSGNGTISRTRASGKANSCRPSWKLTRTSASALAADAS